MSSLASLLETPTSPPPTLASDTAVNRSDLPDFGLSEAARHQILVEWNDTGADAATGRRLEALFAARAAAAPDAVAVSCGDRQLTYGELAARVERLAGRLRALGVGPGDHVAVHLPRSLEVVEALLGILAAGAAYVPVDANLPRARAEQVLGTLGIATAVTLGTRLEELLAGGRPGLRIVRLDRPAAEPSAAPASSGRRTTADELAYVIFTSGTTGTPSGVAVAHRPVANLIEWAVAAYGFTSSDRILFTTSLSFDLSVFDLFGLLAVGGAIHVASGREVQDPAALAALVDERAITFWDSAPAALARLEPFFGEAGARRSLRLVFLSGDWVPLALPGAVARAFTGCRVVALGGATEATVWSNHFPVATVDPAWASIPYGRPISNSGYYVLDGRLAPCPIGTPGDLYIGGACLASGYAADPAKTADRFIPHPFARGERLYRTGDLARFTADGTIEFLGRADHQVKVRGFRVELKEVEAVLGQHPEVKAAVAAAVGERFGERRLVAWVVPENGRLSRRELRSFVAARLPDYMVPAALVLLPALPLTANGKVDRHGLPVPAPGRRDVDTELAPPGTPLERHLAALWAEVLGLPEVGVHDDFFELGGDSIKGAILVNRLQQQLGQHLYFVVVFNAPTIALLARALEEQYPDAVARLLGVEPSRPAALPGASRVDEASVKQMRRLFVQQPRQPGLVAPNRRAVFILCPPRSGSTLLRVMLGGHPQLFSPPTLELLPFNTLAERRRFFSPPYDFRMQGLVRAVMELRGCDANQAEELLGERAERGATAHELFGELQGWLGPRLLIDKSPSYAFHPESLARAETNFDGALFIHLLRHPAAMAHSFAEVRADQAYGCFFKQPPPFSRQELGELVWLVCHQNVLGLLRHVPAERQMRLAFEDLVRRPEGTIDEVCRFLGVEPHPAMLTPYDGDERRMTDGIAPLARMLGDVKFHTHRGIDPSVAERFKAAPERPRPGGLTWQVAAELGYARDEEREGLVL